MVFAATIKVTHAVSILAPSTNYGLTITPTQVPDLLLFFAGFFYKSSSGVRDDEIAEGSRGMHLAVEACILSCMSSLWTLAFVEPVVDTSAIPGPCMILVFAPHARKCLGTTQGILFKVVETCTLPCTNSRLVRRLMGYY